MEQKQKINWITLDNFSFDTDEIVGVHLEKNKLALIFRGGGVFEYSNSDCSKLEFLRNRLIPRGAEFLKVESSEMTVKKAPSVSIDHSIGR
jgi:hypothetical protein